MKEFISFIDFTNMSDEEKYKLLNSKDYETERLKEELKYTIPIVEHNKTITKHLKEKERLNNIINNIENYIRARADDSYTCSVCSVMTDDLLNILKGVDKE